MELTKKTLNINFFCAYCMSYWAMDATAMPTRWWVIKTNTWAPKARDLVAQRAN